VWIVVLTGIYFSITKENNYEQFLIWFFIDTIFTLLTNIKIFLKKLRLFLLLLKLQKPYLYKRHRIQPADKQPRVNVKRQRKPEWVKREIIRLKAFMIHDGCRKVADAFNRLHGDKRATFVSKTYVAGIICKHHHEILRMRKKIRSRTPKPLPKNLIWSIDLTQVKNDEGAPATVLGIVDSGTRLCLQLREIHNKASISLLRFLLDTIEKHGKPGVIKTDNEAVFTSKLFRLGLWSLNIKHQRSEVCCPWMNGKIERLFGTLKQKLAYYTVNSSEQLAADLDTFRFWFNHVRTHQYLNGVTPAEAWNNQIVSKKNPFIFSAWNGALTGIYFSPS